MTDNPPKDQPMPTPNDRASIQSLADAAYQRGLAEGRRQATERFIAECNASARDYRRRYRTGPPPPPGLVDERPRDLRSLHVAVGMELACNLARHRLLADGPWEPAEQHERAPEPPVRPGHCGNDVYVHEPHEWLSLSDDGKTVTKRSCVGTGPIAGRLLAGRVVDPAPPTEDDITAALAAETPIELSDLPGTWPADVEPAPGQPMMVTTGDTTPDSAAPR